MHISTCTPVPSFALPLVLRRGRSAHGRRQSLELGSLRNLILINEPIYKSCVDEFVEEFRRDGLHATSMSTSYSLAENCTFVFTAWRSRCLGLPSYKKLLPSARLSRPWPTRDRRSRTSWWTRRQANRWETAWRGEIWVSLPSNASGYHGHPSASREVFCARVPGVGK